MTIKQLYPFDLNLRNPLDSDHTREIFCTVCGQDSLISNFTENRRESGFCENCNSWNRQRMLGYLLIDQIKQKYNVHLMSLASTKFPDNIKIFNAEWYGATHKTLKRLKNYSFCKYAGSLVKSGDIVDGYPHQNLQNTSFEENELDIVLTSDVLEHVPEPYVAHQEIYRILNFGGTHIFTVPSNMNVPVDQQRAYITGDKVEHLCSPTWHGKENDSNLVYNNFGLEMITILWKIGFTVRLYEVENNKLGIVGPRSIGFVAEKTHQPLIKDVPTGLR